MVGNRVLTDKSIDGEIAARMPGSLRLMMEIEEKARRCVDQILADVSTGKTTIEAEIRRREGDKRP